MTLHKILTAFIAYICLTASGPVNGKVAPDFTLPSSTGAMVSLKAFRGTPVILEWSNHDCPFVRKHYGAGNMQRLQRQLTEAGAVWLTIISSAPGQQGHVDAEEAERLTHERGAYPSHVLLDPDGTVGTAYRARTTPHMYLIDENGVLLYQGAIDDKPSARRESLDGATNYVLAAWDAYQSGEAIDPAQTKPYGCTVKYAQ